MNDKQKQMGELKKLEAKLKNEVDADFFLDPQHFRTLPRVIDILGAQLLESDPKALSSATALPNLNGHVDYQKHFDQLHKNNPAYASLRKQQHTVEEAIEHLSLVHYKDLNSSVVAVGKVSRRFGEAVGHVKDLRAQVQEIRQQLTNSTVGNAIQPDGEGNEDDVEADVRDIASAVAARSHHSAGGKSLRELWMKKLESEAVLNLLQKLEVVRRTPGAFDSLVHSQPCRVGAAVVLLSDAIDIVFKGDISQIPALNKITEQLMSRKQKAEELLWETLQDIIYLKTGNYPADHGKVAAIENDAAFHPSNIAVMKLDSTSASNKSGGLDGKRRTARGNFQQPQRKHQFVSTYNQRNTEEDEDDQSFDSAMIDDEFSFKSGQEKGTNQRLNKPSLRKNVTTGSMYASNVDAHSSSVFANFHNHQGHLLPKVMLDSEIDLESDELRCMESFGNSSFSTFSNDGTLILPRYNDPILGLRILIEALAKLNRLDDVERVVTENIDRELRKIAEMEQAKTLAKLEKRRNKNVASKRRGVTMSIDVAEEKLKDFRIHIMSLLTSFGSVMLRLSHLAQILRHRISSDPKINTPSYDPPSSALHGVLVAASVKMQREVKSFLHGCLNESEDLRSAFQSGMRMVTPSMMGTFDKSASSISSSANAQSGEGGIFSLGIVNDASLASSIREKYAQNLSTATRSSVMRMSAEEYVIEILCPRTGVVPQIRHALSFRKAIAAWTKECSDLKKELAIVTHEDTTSPVYNATTEETALQYLDNVIQKTLLPMMQQGGEQGTIAALDRRDSFDPITGVGIYNSKVKGKKLKVEMCVACQGLYSATGPLFSALPKLPRGGEMYTPLVASLEQSVAMFLSRVKKRILEICDGKKAFSLLEDKAGGYPTKLSNDMETRHAFTQLWNSYFDEDTVGLQHNVDSPKARSKINPISPPTGDTKAKYIGDDDRSGRLSLRDDVGAGEKLEREQESFEVEVSHLIEILNFTDPMYAGMFKLSTEDEFLRAISLSHSLLKLSSLLEKRVKPKDTWSKAVIAPRTLRDYIKNIRKHGLMLAKFCRLEVLLQTVQRMATIYQSSTLTAKDRIALPSSVNSLGEYLSSISDQMRENGGNKVAAYALSSLEQYVPLFIMETVRIIAIGDGLPRGFKISLHGVEALDKCCSVLYRDLKSATGFENSFWDEAIAADAFDRAASYVALMEFDMDELTSHWRNNRGEFTDDDYRIMFAMNGPNRRGDIQKYATMKEKKGIGSDLIKRS